jgi:hypothetical protein
MGLPPLKTIEEICALSQEQVEGDLRTIRAAKEPIASRREQLAAELQRVTDEEIRLAVQEEILALVLRLHRQPDVGEPDVAATLNATADTAPSHREQSISANVLSIMRQTQGLAVRPAYVQRRLAEVGIEADDKVVRNALRRWAERGVLHKERYDYRFADRPDGS